MNEQREQEAKIAEYIIGVFKAICDRCSHEDTVECYSDDEAASSFYRDGWRAKRVRLLCKRCNDRLK